MSRFVLFDEYDDDRAVAAERRPTTGGTTGGCATRVEIESGLGWVGVDHAGGLTVELDARVLRTTPADRLGDHLVRALNRALDDTRTRS